MSLFIRKPWVNFEHGDQVVSRPVGVFIGDSTTQLYRGFNSHYNGTGESLYNWGIHIIPGYNDTGLSGFLLTNLDFMVHVLPGSSWNATMFFFQKKRPILGIIFDNWWSPFDEPQLFQSRKYLAPQQGELSKMVMGFGFATCRRLYFPSSNKMSLWFGSQGPGQSFEQ